MSLSHIPKKRDQWNWSTQSIMNAFDASIHTYDASVDTAQIANARCVEWGYSIHHCGLCIMALKIACEDSHPQHPLTINLLSAQIGAHC